MPAKIDPNTTIGPVHLTVGDLDRSVEFYAGRLGFQPARRREGVARFGAGGREALVLYERRGAQRSRGTTGLYHFAILVPSRRELARTLAHLRDTRTPLTGASDHGVSEALYLEDPDGNGIEIYRDRAPGEWPRAEGKIRMATDPLDLEALLAERGAPDAPWTGLAPGTTIGHIHLHVSNLEEAERFYVDVLGFDPVVRYGDSASFVSAGGYHHHVGLNVWAGVGAPPPPPDATGLRHFVVRVPDAGERDRVARRVREAGVLVEEKEDGLGFADPSSNRIVLSAGGT